jgi:hypothetical protein
VTTYVNRTGDTVTDNAVYDNLTRTIFPVLSVFMPPANNSRAGPIMAGAWAQMTCLRASHFSKGSRVPPALPSPTPVHIPRPLSKGAKAGIAIVVVVGVALIAAAIWFFVVRTMRWKAAAVKDTDADAGKSDDIHEGAAQQLVGKEKYEIAGDQSHGHELGQEPSRSEASGTPVTKANSAGVPEELDGQAHHQRNIGPPSELQG